MLGIIIAFMLGSTFGVLLMGFITFRKSEELEEEILHLKLENLKLKKKHEE
jgi:hypothetical protein